jgi:ABC-type sugar transport system ATPase subunit
MIETFARLGDPLLKLLILDSPPPRRQPAASNSRTHMTRAAAGVAVIFISHKFKEVAAIATRILVLRNGS